MEALVYDCPVCGEELRLSDDQVGKTIPCPECSRPIRIEPMAATPRRESSPPGNLKQGQRDAERTLVRTHPPLFRSHPVAMVLACGLILLGVIGLVTLPFGLFDFASGTVIGIMAGVFLIAGLAWIGVNKLKNMMHRLEVTTYRTRQTDGLLNKQSTEVQHDDVTNIRVNQSMIERVFNVGYIGISAGDAEKMEIEARGMPDPGEIAKLIREYQNRLTG